MVSLAGCSSGGGATGGPEASAPAPDAGGDASDAGGDSGAGPIPIPLSGCAAAHTVKVTIGGSQPFDMLVDTGSTTTAVAAKSCATCTGLSPLYAPGSGAVDLKKTVQASYASSPPIGWKGEVYEDSVALGAMAPVDVDLAAIVSQSSFFALDACGKNGYQGILGLGQTAIELAGTTSYLDRLAASGSPDVFAFHTCPSGGELWLGGYDPTATPVYTPMTAATKFYTVILSEVKIAGQSLGLPATDYGAAFVDTGSTNFFLPGNAFTAVTAAIGKSAAFTQLFGAPSSFFSFGNPSCTSVKKTKAELDSELPPLTLVFGSNPGAVVQAPATESYLFGESDGKGGTCYAPGLLETPSGYPGLPPVDLGAPILNGKLVVIDRAQHRVGFAQGAACP